MFKNSTRRFLLTSALVFAFATSVFSNSAFADPKWTFFVFLNGHNNLDPAGHEDVSEMVKGMQAAKDDRVRVIVQWASIKNTQEDPTRGVRRIEVTSQGIKEIESLGKIDMGDAKVLREFLDWGLKTYPSEEVYIDVWDHGSGWKTRGRNRVKAISADDFTGNMITTEQLGEIFNENIVKASGGKKVVLGFDACLQAGCELSSEFRQGVKLMVASAEVEPGAGWPYNVVLEKIHQAPAESLTPQFIGETVAKSYIDFYEGKTVGTLSVIDVGQSLEFEKSIRSFVDIVKKVPDADKKAILESSHLSLRYSEDEYVDLGDFMNSIIKRTREGTKNTELIEACEKVNTSLKSIVTYNGVTKDMQQSSGLSIWLPRADPEYLQNSGRYAKLQFTLGSGWNEFIDGILDFQGTHRAMLCDIYMQNANVFAPKKRKANPNLEHSFPSKQKAKAKKRR